MSDHLLAEFDEAFFQEDWEWLDLYHPSLARKVAQAVERGVSAASIRSRALELGGANRIGIATRCENAAHYLIAQKQKA